MKNNNEELNKLLSLSKEELDKIFSRMSLMEVTDLLKKLNEVSKND